MDDDSKSAIVRVIDQTSELLGHSESVGTELTGIVEQLLGSSANITPDAAKLLRSSVNSTITRWQKFQALLSKKIASGIVILGPSGVGKSHIRYWLAKNGPPPHRPSSTRSFEKQTLVLDGKRVGLIDTPGDITHIGQSEYSRQFADLGSAKILMVVFSNGYPQTADVGEGLSLIGRGDSATTYRDLTAFRTAALLEEERYVNELIAKLTPRRHTHDALHIVVNKRDLYQDDWTSVVDRYEGPIGSERGVRVPTGFAALLQKLATAATTSAHYRVSYVAAEYDSFRGVRSPSVLWSRDRVGESMALLAATLRLQLQSARKSG